MRFRFKSLILFSLLLLFYFSLGCVNKEPATNTGCVDLSTYKAGSCVLDGNITSNVNKNVQIVCCNITDKDKKNYPDFTGQTKDCDVSWGYCNTTVDITNSSGTIVKTSLEVPICGLVTNSSCSIGGCSAFVCGVFNYNPSVYAMNLMAPEASSDPKNMQKAMVSSGSLSSVAMGLLGEKCKFMPKDDLSRIFSNVDSAKVDVFRLGYGTNYSDYFKYRFIFPYTDKYVFSGMVMPNMRDRFLNYPSVNFSQEYGYTPSEDDSKFKNDLTSDYFKSAKDWNDPNPKPFECALPNPESSANDKRNAYQCYSNDCSYQTWFRSVSQVTAWSWKRTDCNPITKTCAGYDQNGDYSNITVYTGGKLYDTKYLPVDFNYSKLNDMGVKDIRTPEEYYRIFPRDIVFINNKVTVHKECYGCQKDPSLSCDKDPNALNGNCEDHKNVIGFALMNESAFKKTYLYKACGLIKAGCYREGSCHGYDGVYDPHEDEGDYDLGFEYNMNEFPINNPYPDGDNGCGGTDKKFDFSSGTMGVYSDYNCLVNGQNIHTFNILRGWNDYYKKVVKPGNVLQFSIPDHTYVGHTKGAALSTDSVIFLKAHQVGKDWYLGDCFLDSSTYFPITHAYGWCKPKSYLTFAQDNIDPIKHAGVPNVTIQPWSNSKVFVDGLEYDLVNAYTENKIRDSAEGTLSVGNKIDPDIRIFAGTNPDPKSEWFKESTIKINGDYRNVFLFQRDYHLLTSNTRYYYVFDPDQDRILILKTGAHDYDDVFSHHNGEYADHNVLYELVRDDNVDEDVVCSSDQWALHNNELICTNRRDRFFIYKPKYAENNPTAFGSKTQYLLFHNVQPIIGLSKFLTFVVTVKYNEWKANPSNGKPFNFDDYITSEELYGLSGNPIIFMPKYSINLNGKNVISRAFKNNNYISHNVFKTIKTIDPNALLGLRFNSFKQATDVYNKNLDYEHDSDKSNDFMNMFGGGDDYPIQVMGIDINLNDIANGCKMGSAVVKRDDLKSKSKCIVDNITTSSGKLFNLTGKSMILFLHIDDKPPLNGVYIESLKDTSSVMNLTPYVLQRVFQAKYSLVANGLLGIVVENDTKPTINRMHLVSEGTKTLYLDMQPLTYVSSTPINVSKTKMKLCNDTTFSNYKVFCKATDQDGFITGLNFTYSNFTLKKVRDLPVYQNIIASLPGKFKCYLSDKENDANFTYDRMVLPRGGSPSIYMHVPTKKSPKAVAGDYCGQTTEVPTKSTCALSKTYYYKCNILDKTGKIIAHGD